MIFKNVWSGIKNLFTTEVDFREPFSFPRIKLLDDVIKERIKQKDLHPSGALWGRGSLRTEGAALALEKEVASRFDVLTEGLERNGLKQERKALRLNVDDLDYTYVASNEIDDEAVVSLSFSLPAGAYATSVLAEIGDFN